jgi:hypothetical protein
MRQHFRKSRFEIGSRQFPLKLDEVAAATAGMAGPEAGLCIERKGVSRALVERTRTTPFIAGVLKLGQSRRTICPHFRR